MQPGRQDGICLLHDRNQVAEIDLATWKVTRVIATGKIIRTGWRGLGRGNCRKKLAARNAAGVRLPDRACSSSPAPS